MNKFFDDCPAAWQPEELLDRRINASPVALSKALTGAPPGQTGIEPPRDENIDD
jgi:hypothetical protein